MRRFDQFSNYKVVRATAALEHVCRQLRLSLVSIKLDSSEINPISDSTDSLFRSAFGALKGVNSMDLRRADGGARKQLERAEADLGELRRRFLAELPPTAKILSDLIQEKQGYEELLGEVVALDPSYRDSAPLVMVGPGSSIIGVLAVIYLCIKHRQSSSADRG